MILYTIVPQEELLDPEAPPDPEAWVLWAGRHLQVRPRAQGGAEVVRLMSTDPADYLDPRWQPGTIIAWPPR